MPIRAIRAPALLSELLSLQIARGAKPRFGWRRRTSAGHRRPPLPAGVAAGGHGGSQGNLGHEFSSALLENRPPMIDIYESLAMTVPGIIAHQSALKDGETLKIPQFDRLKTS